MMRWCLRGGCKSLFGGKQQRSRPSSCLRSRPTFSSLGIVCGHAIAASRYSNITRLVNMIKYITGLMCFELPTRPKMCTLYPSI
uniref:Uncharacterized protein n=1 Tax=Lactuca sativa TaxID=4236 RepID=A0A9R1XT12_LACSA|nr:hypothetical protein LSAT_V11C300112970 [Lactuca sativa]